MHDHQYISRHCHFNVINFFWSVVISQKYTPQACIKCIQLCWEIIVAYPRKYGNVISICIFSRKGYDFYNGQWPQINGFRWTGLLWDFRFGHHIISGFLKRGIFWGNPLAWQLMTICHCQKRTRRLMNKIVVSLVKPMSRLAKDNWYLARLVKLRRTVFSLLLSTMLTMDTGQ